MVRKKPFQKIVLNSEDYKWIEKAAKVTKGAAKGIAYGGTIAVTALVTHAITEGNTEETDDPEEKEVE